MNSRERVFNAISHKEGPLAIDFGSLHSSLHVDAYKSVIKYFGWKEHNPKIQDWFQMIVFPCADLLERFGADCIPIYTNPGKNWKFEIIKKNNSEYFTNEWGILLKKPKGGYFFDLCSNPLQKADSLEKIKEYQFPDPEDPSRIQGLKEKVKNLRENTEKAIILFCPTAGVFEHSYFLRGLTELLMDLVINPDIVDYLAAKISEWQQSYFSYVLKEIGSYVDIVQIGDDLGTTNGLIFSLDMYKKYYKKRHKAVIDAIRKTSKAVIYFHSCGAIREIIPELIDIGIDILNPIQVRAKGMDSKDLKEDFGRYITFWGGGCDPNILTSGSNDDVREEVKTRIKHLSPGGGFVFAPIHNIQTNIPAENIVTMFETALKYR